MTAAAEQLAPSAPVAPPTPGRVRGDLRFLRIYALTTRRVMRYRPHPVALAASEEPSAIADRIESGLAGEATRYRRMGACILALLVGIPLLSGVLWSAMYWLSIYWWPFERGNYGLPFFSLFEWLCYLMLAAYFVATGVLLARSHDETCRLGTEYRRLADATAENRDSFAAALTDGSHPRSAYVVRVSPAFAAYRELLDVGSTK